MNSQLQKDFERTLARLHKENRELKQLIGQIKHVTYLCSVHELNKPMQEILFLINEVVENKK